MSFNFFTFGGNSYWEDIFFYQKWRIQRHVNTGVYRLLDQWDISRQEGTFEDCRRKFIDYIEAYQISRQNGHMIIMLHGFGENKKVFRPLWREVARRGFLAAALNYPSTHAPIDSHVRQLDFFLNHLEDVNEISFVVKGSSCLILRKLFSLPSAWQRKLKVRRILLINPTNSGNHLISWLAKLKIFRFLFGPMATEVSPAQAILIPKLPAQIEQGSIFGDSIFKKAARLVTKPFESTPVIDETSEENYIVQAAYVDNTWHRVFNNPEILQAALNFLQKGKFL